MEFIVKAKRFLTALIGQCHINGIVDDIDPFTRDTELEVELVAGREGGPLLRPAFAHDLELIGLCPPSIRRAGFGSFDGDLELRIIDRTGEYGESQRMPLGDGDAFAVFAELYMDLIILRRHTRQIVNNVGLLGVGGHRQYGIIVSGGCFRVVVRIVKRTGEVEIVESKLVVVAAVERELESGEHGLVLEFDRAIGLSLGHCIHICKVHVGLQHAIHHVAGLEYHFFWNCGHETTIVGSALKETQVAARHGRRRIHAEELVRARAPDKAVRRVGVRCRSAEVARRRNRGVTAGTARRDIVVDGIIRIMHGSVERVGGLVAVDADLVARHPVDAFFGVCLTDDHARVNSLCLHFTVVPGRRGLELDAPAGRFRNEFGGFATVDKQQGGNHDRHRQESVCLSHCHSSQLIVVFPVVNEGIVCREVSQVLTDRFNPLNVVYH